MVALLVILLIEDLIVELGAVGHVLGDLAQAPADAIAKRKMMIRKSAESVVAPSSSSEKSPIINSKTNVPNSSCLLARRA